MNNELSVFFDGDVTLSNSHIYVHTITERLYYVQNSLSCVPTQQMVYIYWDDA